MAESTKEPKLPTGIYPPRVDLGLDDTPAVPEPEVPPPPRVRPEVPRREWLPKWIKYIKDRKAGKI